MSRTIWKYPLGFNTPPIHMPLDSEILYVGAQLPDDVTPVTIWVEVDPAQSQTEPRMFRIVGTGGSVPDKAWHWGSVVDNDRGFVWHVYELAQ